MQASGASRASAVTSDTPVCLLMTPIEEAHNYSTPKCKIRQNTLRLIEDWNMTEGEAPATSSSWRRCSELQMEGSESRQVTEPNFRAFQQTLYRHPLMKYFLWRQCLQPFANPHTCLPVGCSIEPSIQMWLLLRRFLFWLRIHQRSRAVRRHYTP